MYPHLVLENLVAEHPRDGITGGAGERVAATIVGHKRNWWTPVLTTLRHLVLPMGSGRQLRDANLPLAIIKRAQEDPAVRPASPEFGTRESFS
jgi:hypothetical protein